MTLDVIQGSERLVLVDFDEKDETQATVDTEASVEGEPSQKGKRKDKKSSGRRLDWKNTVPSLDGPDPSWQRAVPSTASLSVGVRLTESHGDTLIIPVNEDTYVYGSDSEGKWRLRRSENDSPEDERGGDAPPSTEGTSVASGAPGVPPKTATELRPGAGSRMHSAGTVRARTAAEKVVKIADTSTVITDWFPAGRRPIAAKFFKQYEREAKLHAAGDIRTIGPLASIDDVSNRSADYKPLHAYSPGLRRGKTADGTGDNLSFVADLSEKSKHISEAEVQAHAASGLRGHKDEPSVLRVRTAGAQGDELDQSLSERGTIMFMQRQKMVRAVHRERANVLSRPQALPQT